MTLRLGLQPQAVFEQFALWQPVTYMFLHDIGGVGHILINMLSLWMFGTELERTWGTRFFTKYYFVTGIGAAATSLILSLFIDSIYYTVTVGASGAIYGLLLGYGMYFPNRPIYLYFIFPIPAKYFVMIVGAIAFLSALGGPGGGVAHTAHLGGLVVGYLYLKGLKARPFDEIKYRWLRWKMGRARSRFDVYSGGRSSEDDWKSDWKKHIH
jgi:membrane associated rhomboid family serine protease